MSIQSTIEAAASTADAVAGPYRAGRPREPLGRDRQHDHELAAECDTSVASVVRFCRAIVFSG